MSLLDTPCLKQEEMPSEILPAAAPPNNTKLHPYHQTPAKQPPPPAFASKLLEDAAYPLLETPAKPPLSPDTMATLETPCFKIIAQYTDQLQEQGVLPGNGAMPGDVVVSEVGAVTEDRAMLADRVVQEQRQDALGITMLIYSCARNL